MIRLFRKKRKALKTKVKRIKTNSYISFAQQKRELWWQYGTSANIRGSFNREHYLKVLNYRYETRIDAIF